MRSFPPRALRAFAGGVAASLVRCAPQSGGFRQMSKASLIVLGGTGLIGSAVCEHFTSNGHVVIPINSKNYEQCAGSQADVLVNCNGNSYRFKAGQNPRWDFDASVLSVEKS